MLFLAVFCGFLAENFREHNVEHKREKQYMSSMLEDLKNDTVILAQAFRYWDKINNCIDSVGLYSQFPFTKTNQVKTYLFLNKAMDFYSFIYNDRTIAQLKNSGGFRLIRNSRVANMIILFDQFNNDAMKNIAEIHETFYKTMMHLANKVFVQEIINELYRRYDFNLPGPENSVWIDSLIQKNRNPLTDEAYHVLLFEFRNSLLAYRKDYDQNVEWGYEQLKQKMEELIKVIGEEYHMK
jgi:hypothetical protein